MVFFKIQILGYDVEKIEAQIVASVNKRGIKETEKNIVDNYDLNTWKEEIYNRPINRFKLMFFKLPRWIISFLKWMPFYTPVRNFIHRKFLQVKIS